MIQCPYADVNSPDSNTGMRTWIADMDSLCTISCKKEKDGIHMAFISIFDVLGPEMIGPSSSHTAGACSIALLAGKMADSPITFDNYPMSWKPDLSRASGPKYLALVSLMEDAIKNGTLKAGTKLPPQRELADYLNVNLSTISRAFKLCSQKGLLSASVGNGTYVCADVTAETVLLCGRENPRMIEMGALVPQVSGNRLVKSYTERLLKRPDALNLFSYDDPEGTGLQREAGVAWFQKSGFHTDKEHVLLAAGGQNALTASLGALLERGNKLGTDPLTYPGVKNAAKLLGIHLIPIQNNGYEMTEEGTTTCWRRIPCLPLLPLPRNRSFTCQACPKPLPRVSEPPMSMCRTSITAAWPLPFIP